MTATTPKRALTYVTPADKPQVYPAASKALADSLDALVGLTATACTAGAKVTINTATSNRVSGLLVVTINVITTAAVVAGDTLLTLPAGHTPVALFYGAVVNTSTDGNLRVHLDVDRTIKAQGAVGSGITLRGTVIGATA